MNVIQKTGEATLVDGFGAGKPSPRAVLSMQGFFASFSMELPIGIGISRGIFADLA